MAGFTRKQLEDKDKDELIDIILSLQSLVESLVDKVSSLEKEVSRLKKPTTSRNSSLPPSKDLSSARYPKRRSGGGGKTGGCTGIAGLCGAAGSAGGRAMGLAFAFWVHAPTGFLFRQGDLELAAQRLLKVVDVIEIFAAVTVRLFH